MDRRPNLSCHVAFGLRRAAAGLGPALITLVLAALLVPAVGGLEPIEPVALAADGKVGAGRKLFAVCKTCHRVKPGAPRFGPHLGGLFGRPAGAVDGYDYSDGLRASGIVWDEAELDKWLSGPGDYVPGSQMNFPGFDDPQDRADVIAYLKRATSR